MKKDRKIPNCGSWAQMPGTKIVVGARQLRKALLAGRARYVLLAQDADPSLTEPIEELCRQRSAEEKQASFPEKHGKIGGLNKKLFEILLTFPNCCV